MVIDMSKTKPLSIGMLERIFEAAKDCEAHFSSSSQPVTLSNVTLRLFKDFASAAKSELGTDGMLYVEVEAVENMQYGETKYATVNKQHECKAVMICAAALYARKTFVPD